MSLTVYEADGTLADPAYLAALVRDMTAYEKATGNDPDTRHFHAWADMVEEAVQSGRYGPCADCGEVEDLASGLCRGCWEGQRSE
jgi:hypothetical protein